MLPGELDPKLALAATAELRGAHADATRYYETVWQTNHTFYSAAFGLARERARAGNGAGAVATLDQITPASAHFTAAGTAAIEILLDGRTANDLDEPALLDAGTRASSLTIDSAVKRETLRMQRARRRAGVARSGEYAEDRAAARLRLRRTRHPGRNGAVLPRTGARDDRRVGAYRPGGKSECSTAEDQTMNGGRRVRNAERRSWPPTGSVRAAAPCSPPFAA